MKKVLIAEDSSVIQNLAKKILEFQNFEIHSVKNGQQVLDALENEDFDILLLDINMPVMDGMETAGWLKKNFPKIKILALSMLKSDLVVIRMLRNGAGGYILKDCDSCELRTALEEIYEHGYFYNDLVTPKMTARHLSPDIILLNTQELSFLRWACTELTHKQIADEMGVSPRTVDGYRDSLFRKLQVNSRVGIAVYAIKNGLVQI